MFSLSLRATLALVAGLLLTRGALTQPPEPQPPKGKEDVKEAMARVLKKAQEEYRVFFKKPETVPEFWVAVTFEIQLGKFDVAALHLNQMLQKQPAEQTDDGLLQIEEVEGLSSFLRLRQIRKWFDQPDLQAQAEKDVESLIQRVTVALDKKLSDPARINKFIKSLSAPTHEERQFAFAQIKRSKERAVPYLVEALRVNAGKPTQQRLAQVMLELDSDIVPPLLEALRPLGPEEPKETDLRYLLLDIIQRRADARVIPTLWHLSSGPGNPPLIRAKAKEMLSQFLGIEPENLPVAKVVLTDLAEKYFQHQVRFADPKRIPIWPWTGNKLDPKVVVLSASDAEELYGLRYARAALELDPAYRRAQSVYLSLALERALRDKLDQMLTQPLAPELRDILATVDIDLLLALLERALNDRNLPVILATAQTLGDRGDSRAARPTASGAAGPLVRALYYPDRRVQVAAVRSLLRLPQVSSPVASTRVVEVLKRNLAAEPVARALVIGAPDTKAAEMRQLVKAIGFEPVLAPTLKEAFALLRQSAAFDVLILDPSLFGPELPFALTQLRSDSDVGLLPLFLLAAAARQPELAKLAERHANTAILPEVLLGMPAEVQQQVENAIKFAGQPLTVLKAPVEQKGWLEEDVKKGKSPKLTEPERKGVPREALDALWRMARGEITGYDLRPTKDAVLTALNDDETALQALEILAKLPGAETQQRLAALVLDARRPKLRVPAAFELNRHMQKNGLNLTGDQIAQLRALYNTPMDDPALRGQLANVIGSLPATATQTGERLLGPTAKQQ